MNTGTGQHPSGHCPYCGAVNSMNTAYCTVCHTQLPWAETPATWAADDGCMARISLFSALAGICFWWVPRVGLAYLLGSFVLGVLVVIGRSPGRGMAVLAVILSAAAYVGLRVLGITPFND